MLNMTFHFKKKFFFFLDVSAEKKSPSGGWTYADVLQLQHPGGVVRLDVFGRERDGKTCVPEGHRSLLGRGPVLGALLLSG